MADLTLWADDGRRDRAQVILVTGFALAVAFVALALVVNSVIYTENLATRSASASASDAVTLRQDAGDGTARLIASIDEHHAGETYGDLRARLRAGVENVSAIVRRYQVVDGRAVTTSLVAVQRGAWIEQQSAPRPFTNASGDADWTPVNDSAGAHSFRFHVVNTTVLGGKATRHFAVVARNGSKTWRLEIYSNASNYVGVVHHADGSDRTCTGALPTDFWVNVSAGTFAGSPCPGLGFADGLGGVENVSFSNGDTINGTYRLLVGKADTALDVSDFGVGGPTNARAIYGATVHLAYESARFRYETDVAAVPGDRDA
ncbi:MAG: hypothetical protein ABEJ31_00480 [Haloarculaceae archaeon]